MSDVTTPTPNYAAGELDQWFRDEADALGLTPAEYAVVLADCTIAVLHDKRTESNRVHAEQHDQRRAA